MFRMLASSLFLLWHGFTIENSCGGRARWAICPRRHVGRNEAPAVFFQFLARKEANFMQRIKHHREPEWSGLALHLSFPQRIVPDLMESQALHPSYSILRNILSPENPRSSPASFDQKDR